MNYTTPPQLPAPKKDNKLQIIAASLFALAIVILLIVIAAPSDSSSDIAQPDPEPVITAPVENKYDNYYEYVLSNSGKANTFGKANVIEYGDLVCQSLDEGSSIASIARVITNASGSQSDIELGATVVFGAITHICPEYDAMLQAYINN
jgi:hypothetical protein